MLKKMQLVILYSIVFHNNTVTDGGWGGAVYANSSPIFIENSTFNSNTACYCMEIVEVVEQSMLNQV